MKLVINIPCYNEEKTLSKLLSRIPKRLAGVDEVEIQVVDDGSKDNTLKIAHKHGVHVVRHKKNLGLGMTFRDGINNALKHGADIIVNIDGDGQFDPQDIPKLISPILEEKADMVTCTRFLKPSMTKNMPGIKIFGNKVFTAIINKISGKSFTDTQCGFRAYSREAALRLSLFGRFTYTQEVFLDLLEKGMKIVEVPLPVVYHASRKSKMVSSVRAYAFKSMGIILRATRDINPLNFFGIPALISFLLGCIGGGVSLIYWLVNLRTTPVRMLLFVSAFLVVFGVVLGILALVADMLLRMRLTNDELLYRMKKERYRKK